MRFNISLSFFPQCSTQLMGTAMEQSVFSPSYLRAIHTMAAPQMVALMDTAGVLRQRTLTKTRCTVSAPAEVIYPWVTMSLCPWSPYNTWPHCLSSCHHPRYGGDWGKLRGRALPFSFHILRQNIHFLHQWRSRRWQAVVRNDKQLWQRPEMGILSRQR